MWIADAYTLAFAALLLAAGALADRYGAKTIYQAGLAVFTLASLLCGMAPDGPALIAARMLQGVGAALFMPSSLSLLTHAYTEERTRNRMLGAWSAIVAVAGASGPAGRRADPSVRLARHLSHQPAVGAGGSVAGQPPHQPAPRRPRALNASSHLLGMAALATASYALIEGNAYGWSSPRIATAIALALAAAILLVRRERRHADPILPRALFETPRFAAANGVGFLVNLGGYGQLFLISLFLQQARGADALQTGIQMVPMLAIFSIGNLASGRIAARWNVSAALLGGLSIATVLSAASIVAMSPGMPYWCFALLATGANLGLGLVVPAMTSLVMQVSGTAHANSGAAR